MQIIDGVPYKRYRIRHDDVMRLAVEKNLGSVVYRLARAVNFAEPHAFVYDNSVFKHRINVYAFVVILGRDNLPLLVSKYGDKSLAAVAFDTAFESKWYFRLRFDLVPDRRDALASVVFYRIDQHDGQNEFDYEYQQKSQQHEITQHYSVYAVDFT